MAIIHQHIPNFVDTDERKSAEYNNTEDLLNIDFVKAWKKPFRNHNFFRYSLSDNILMVEFGEGKSWWVIGYLSNIDGLDLPKWEPKYEK